MRIIIFIILCSLMAPLNASAQTQTDFAKLEKNVNTRAKGLTHSLNASKDTLILKSESIINKVYSVSMAYKREIDLIVNDTYIEIPLQHLSKGKHVFVAVQSPIRIVFVIKILRDNDVLFAIEEELLAAKNEKE